MMRYLQTAKESLEAFRSGPAPLSAVAESKAATALSADQVTAMNLDDFANASLIVRVRSEILDADVLFVSDNIPASMLSGPEVVYRAHELKKLARVPPDPQHLRNVHMVKEIIGGTIQNIREKDNSTIQDAREKKSRTDVMSSTSIREGDSANG